VAFSSTTVATPIVTGLTGFGQYNLVCQATINGVTGTTIIPVGAVATNAAGVVIAPDPIIQQLLGQQLRSGVSEWRWYDQQRKIMGKYWYDNRAGYTIDFTSNESENYYDACLVQYQNYYRTGLTRFQTYARACSDKWYSQFWSANATAGTCGADFLKPRQSSVVSLAIRAYETGAPSSGTMWTCLTDYAGFELNLWVELRTSPSNDTLYFGSREVAYSLINAHAIAVANPDSAVRSSYSGRLVSVISNPIRSLQCQPGSTILPCTEVYTTGAGTMTATNGSAAVTGSGSNFTSLFAPSGDGVIFNSASTSRRVTVASPERVAATIELSPKMRPATYRGSLPGT
jgi:hypothetical protein